jgi:hypothetical protein
MARLLSRWWVVLDFGNGRVAVVADYGNTIWDSRLYRVVDYFSLRKDALKCAQHLRRAGTASLICQQSRDI